MEQTVSTTNQENTRMMMRKEGKKKDRAPIMPSDLIQNVKNFEAEFVKPRPLHELDGQHGVTLTDIAKGLGVSHKDLKRKIERSGAVNRITTRNHVIRTYVLIAGKNAREVESYTLDLMAAQHIVSKYDNDRGWDYTDFLIRCKDALKISLEAHEKVEAQLDEAKASLKDAQKKIETFTKPRVTRKNNVVIKNIVAEKSDLFHDTIYKVDHDVIKQPQKNEPRYEEHYVQKLAKITKGNAKSIAKALKKMECNMAALNKRVEQMEEASGDVDALINPEDDEAYRSLIKAIEKEEKNSSTRN